MDTNRLSSADTTDDAQAPHCPFCGYDLRGLMSLRCPECGNQFAIVRPGEKLRPNVAFFETRSMRCPNCEHLNRGFMPALCARCGYRFSVLQRLFGVRGTIG